MTRSRETVLIIDDEPGLRQVLGYEFEMQGYEVMEAGNAREGIDLLHRKPGVSLVLTDVRMPGSDGFDFLRALEALPSPRPQTFLMTGDIHMTRDRARALGATGVITKPFDWETLWAEIGRQAS